MENYKLNEFKNNFYQFDRHFFESNQEFSCIGKGSLGGKASGLFFIKNVILSKLEKNKFPSIEISIPRMCVLRTEIFDKFMERNNLFDVACSDIQDDRKAFEFQKGYIPVEIVGDLRALVEEVNLPLAIRSSSLLEDDKDEPFAGIYATKMIPNNQYIDVRFQKLCEAIKFVYASTFFKSARDYINATNNFVENEKMAIIIQEVIGKKYEDRFYPHVSGVARSFNFYPTGKAKPEHGVVNLALGLGKTIVDDGLSWNYSPTFPKAVPPFANPNDMLKNTQTRFWAVNMGHLKEFDPLNENEYLISCDLIAADKDNILKYIASTVDTNSGRITMGVGAEGPRVLNFSPLLVLNEFKFNDLIKNLLSICEQAYENPVEIEFAITFDFINNCMRFGFLQVRAMSVSYDEVTIEEQDRLLEKYLVLSERVLGNGIRDNIQDIVFVKPEVFETKYTPKIAFEIEEINKYLLREKTPYLLMGFGRWGSSDPWLGTPVDWGQIAGAKVIVESTLPNINVELSQGSHFFHNLTSFKVLYFSIHHESENTIDWKWLNEQSTVTEKEFVKHIKLEKPIFIKADGRTGKGVILK
ncbi:MAG: hypothetical protein JXA68_11520 [Ignavibacteriales bacterium]|nr:hypothetical protein [Ignavibacteriales bacterium]